MGASRRTVHKWPARYRRGGQAALNKGSSRPGRSPRRMPVGRVATYAGDDLSALRVRKNKVCSGGMGCG